MNRWLGQKRKLLNCRHQQKPSPHLYAAWAWTEVSTCWPLPHHKGICSTVLTKVLRVDLPLSRGRKRSNLRFGEPTRDQRTTFLQSGPMCLMYPNNNPSLWHKLWPLSCPESLYNFMEPLGWFQNQTYLPAFVSLQQTFFSSTYSFFP